MNLTQAIEKFQAYIGGKSPNTIKTYTTALNHFTRFKHNIQIDNLATDDIPAFLSWLRDRGLAESTINNYTTAITRFYRWLMWRKLNKFEAEDYIRLQEELGELRGGSQRKLPQLPTETVVLETIKAAYVADNDDQRLHLMHLRNAAMLGFLESTGCRIGEVANAKRTDLIHDDRAIKVTGKGNKSRIVYFSDAAWDVIHKYLAARDKVGHRPLGEEPLLSRHDKTAWGREECLSISTNSLRNALTLICRSAGVKHYTPHKLRHRKATDILRATKSIEVTRKVLGHSNIATTQIYSHLTDDDVRDAMRGTT